MWLLHTEETDGVKLMHGCNSCEYRLPELPRFSVDGYCPGTRTVYEFFGFYFYGHTFHPFRDVTTLRGDTLADRYEQCRVSSR